MDSPVLHRELLELKDWMFTNFVTKQEFHEFKSEMLEFKDDSLSRFDSLFGSIEQLKQEQLFTNHSLRRIEAKLGI